MVEWTKAWLIRCWLVLVMCSCFFDVTFPEKPSFVGRKGLVDRVDKRPETGRTRWRTVGQIAMHPVRWEPPSRLCSLW
jgi:hypothetical protein